MGDFERTYEAIQQRAGAALPGIQDRIKRLLGGLGDPYLVRAKVESPRVKSDQSLARKAQSHGWDLDEAITTTSDFIGFRIVCNNLQDVARCADLLEESYQRDGIAVEREDYIKNPKASGYRAIHLTLRVTLHVNGASVDVGCEIQVRSLLQSAWAELSRADIYTEDVPTPIERQVKSLAAHLARADASAEKIRRRIARPGRSRQAKPGQPLTERSLALVYRSVFGDEIPDYLVQNVLRETAGMTMRSDGLHAVLMEEQFVTRLKAVYEDVAGWEAEPPQIFRWAITAMTHGKEAAIRRAVGEARQEWAEIRSIAQREILPDARGFERRLAELEYAQKDDDPEEDIERWASALGASSACLMCGTAIMNPDLLASAAARHYGKSRKGSQSLRKRVKSLTKASGVETGSWETSSLCGHCSYVGSKD